VSNIGSVIRGKRPTGCSDTVHRAARVAAAVDAVKGRIIKVAEQIVLETSMGNYSLLTFASAEEINRLSFHPQFGQHTGFRSLYTRSESLIIRSCQEDVNVVLAVTDNTNIIGFGLLACPEPGQRWSGLGPRTVMEVKAIEVIRDWRQMGVGNALVRGMLSHPAVEERIIYLVGYTWTWDLNGAKMTASQYRKMMVRLFQPFQFSECKTNEPNICLDPDNLFMCRTGKDVSDRLRNDFKWLSFGVYPQ
jgi:acetoin utilization protein AcuA